MGRKSATDTVARIISAFVEESTWRQADLACHLGMGRDATRKRLEELRAAGVPLEREEDNPHVFWSVKAGWFPGCVSFNTTELPDLLRVLDRSPRTRARSRIQAALRKRLPGLAGVVESQIQVPALSVHEERWLDLVETSVAQSSAIDFEYFSASSNSQRSRVASVQRTLLQGPARFIAYCHESLTLKWFRVANMVSARLCPEQPYTRLAAAEVERFEGESLGGFHGAGPSVQCTFFVRAPESHWVGRNLIGGMVGTPVVGGLRVSIETSVVEKVARFVVSLGGAARAESPELRARVFALARGALGSVD